MYSYRYDSEDEYRFDDYNIAKPLEEYNVDENGCPININTYSPFSIAIYDINEPDVENILHYLSSHINDICKSSITQNYLYPSKIIPRNDFLLTLSYSGDIEYDSDSRIVGFAVVSDKRTRTNGDDNTLYIDIICSNNDLHRTRFPGGKVILNVIVEYARKSGYDSVSLKALSNVVNYYRQFGFRFLKHGETNETPIIHELAENNKQLRLPTTGDANRILLIERALMFAREVDEEGVPVFNKELFRKNLQEQLSMNYLPTEEQANEYINLVSHVARVDGHGGLHDLFYTLIKNGYADLDKCPGITRRQFVKPEEIRPGVWKLWMSCEEGGFQMRKLLRSNVSIEKDIDEPIISCSSNNQHYGGKRNRKCSRKCSRKQNHRMHKAFTKTKSRKSSSQYKSKKLKTRKNRKH